MENYQPGTTYNNFTIKYKLSKKARNGQAMFLCECVCGEKREVRKDNLGRVKGCGCIRSTYKPRAQRKAKPSQEIRKIVAFKEKETANKANDQQPYQYNPVARQRIEDIKILRDLEKQFAL